MYVFLLHEGVRLLGRSVLVFSLNLVGPTDHISKIHKICKKTTATYRILLTLRKEYLYITTAKYFHTSDITGFSKSLIVSSLVGTL